MGYRSRDLLVEGDLEGFANLMHEHWMHKRTRSSSISAARIDRLYDTSRQAGVIGGKLVGAGGGGFLLVFSATPEKTRKAMAATGATELPFHFEFDGAVATEFS
jgi:D-glycero-alpha-D-manno-heptose-7-phosphate kinase